MRKLLSNAKMRKWAMPLVSILALIWVLIRVIPKPQRATYPCMKVAIPFAASFILYAVAIGTSLVFFRQAIRKLASNRFIPAGLLLLVAMGFSLSTLFVEQSETQASGMSEAGMYNYEDPLGPNVPIGEAKGILPGRVVWTHNPDATNENCDPDQWGDGYYMDKNANQIVVDAMLDTALLQVTGLSSTAEAWDAIFRYFNSTHDKGDVGYTQGEKIFIKVNAVHAWTTKSDLSIKNDGNYGNVDTSPQVIMAVLRQLVYNAGVPQDAIYIGDPYTQIFKHVYEKLSPEFPDVHYMSKSDSELREKLRVTNTDTLKFSDGRTVMDTDPHTHFDCIVNADYMISLPAMKGHRWAGVTFFGKNHFGSNTADGAWRLHTGLVKPEKDIPLREGYRLYRVIVDLMSYKHLGGKNLVYIGDFLWGTSYEHDPPAKFRSAPFDNDWTSSILVSLDPVAIESVALDILQEEYQVEDLTTDPPSYTYVRFNAVDDYLHQAASSEWWPEDVVYDPEGDGTPIGSLGVHEHWNNATEKKYSRNLGTGEGIELVYLNTLGDLVIDPTSTGSLHEAGSSFRAYLSDYSSVLNLECDRALLGPQQVRIFNASGQLVQTLRTESLYAGEPLRVQLDVPGKGFHIVTLGSGADMFSQAFVIPH
jgi:hypothetical protein